MKLLHAILLLLISNLVAAADLPGAGLFSRECGICHGENGYGTMMLERRLGKDRSLLRERTDLIPAYVRTVVRQGLSSMPPLSRVEVSNAELDAIVDYLTRTEKRNGHE